MLSSFLSFHRVFFLKTSPSIFPIQSYVTGKKIKVLPVVRGKKSPPMILMPKPWVKKLPSLNRTTLERRKGVTTYLPPSSSRVALYRRDTKVSWAPLASTILDLDIHQGTSPSVPILFEFRLGTSLGWKEWVDKSCPTWVSWRHYSKPTC